MTSIRSDAAFRREVAARVLSELSTELPQVSPHFGEQYADSDEPDAQALRECGGSFEWVAFSFDLCPMWDAHVGVLTENGQAIAGLHVHERVSAEKPASVAAVADEIGAKYRYSAVAAEHQFNRPPVLINEVNVDSFAGNVVELCRRFEPVVDALDT